MEEPNGNGTSPELLEKIREKFSPQEVKPKPGPVRIIKKSQRPGKIKDQTGPEGKD